MLIAIIKIYMKVLYSCFKKRSNQYKLNLTMLTYHSAVLKSKVAKEYNSK